MAYKELKEIWEDIKPKQYSISGLFIIFIGSVCLHVGFQRVLAKYWASFTQVNQLEHLLLSAAVSFIYILSRWLYIRRLPTFNSGEIGILFAPYFSDYSIDNEVINLVSKVRLTVAQEFSSQRIKIIKLPPNRIPITDNQAHELREKSRARIIIWGHAETGMMSGDKKTAFSPIRFSYQLPLDQVKTNLFSANLSNLMNRKKWIISNSDSLIDRKLVAENLYEISLVILGISLFFIKDRNLVSDILLKLFDRYNNKPLTPEELQIFNNVKILISRHLVDILVQLLLKPKDKDRSDRLMLAENLLGQMKHAEMADSLLLSGIIKQLNGDTEGAILDIKELSFKLSKTYTAVNYSLTYLYFYKKDFKNALINLREISKRKKIFEAKQLPSILDWYEETMEVEDDKKYLAYPMGYIYYKEVGDDIVAERLFSEFLQNYKNDQSKYISRMKNEAMQMIKKINK